MNCYDTPTAVTIGNAHDLILGVKPFLANNIDSEGQMDRGERIADIDETDD